MEEYEKTELTMLYVYVHVYISTLIASNSLYRTGEEKSYRCVSNKISILDVLNLLSPLAIQSLCVRILSILFGAENYFFMSAVFGMITFRNLRCLFIT